MKCSVIVLVFALAAAASDVRGADQVGFATARVFVPAAVLFEVANVSAESTSSGPVTISFDSAVLGAGQALKVSVRADGDLTLAGALPISATNISWTTANAANGVGLNGTVSRTLYTAVYQGNVDATSGSVTLTWKLSAPGAIQAGTRQASLRWRFEAVTP